MKKIAIALATVATIAAVSAPAEARGGRNAAAIGFGIAAGALAAGAAASSYNAYNSPYYGAYGYETPYYGGGYYSAPRYHGNHSNDPSPMNSSTNYGGYGYY